MKRGHVKSGLKLTIIALSLLALLSACGSGGGGGQTPPSPVIRVTVEPHTASVYTNQSVKFTANVYSSTSGTVTWSLSGAGCSGATCGTISDTGLYIAPADVPSPPTVTVKATSLVDTSKWDSATITILEPLNEWTWVSGSNTALQVGVYGTKGVADPSNVPGARSQAISWRDASDKLWLFGGYVIYSGSLGGYFNDLWEYDPATNEWTWVSGNNGPQQFGNYGTQGVPSSSNVPGSRGLAITWTDQYGKLWLFGGYGLGANNPIGFLNDLWEYDPVTDEWTWFSGSINTGQAGTYGTKGTAAPSNFPGARGYSVSWYTSGYMESPKLWLFGGYGYDSAGNMHFLNDLWEADEIGLGWTWVSGSNTIDQPGIYGTQGIAAPSNIPGARAEAVSWTDATGQKLWLFGGNGYDSTGAFGYLNDLWVYDRQTEEWTWVSGSNTINQAGIYGNKGVPASLNIPGARCSHRSWIDSQGKLWLFGGSGFDSVGNKEVLNDLWEYDPLTNRWAWMSGSNTIDQVGIYGTKGVASSSNIPGARDGPAAWSDSQGNIWVFGGAAYDASGYYQAINDLWKYIR